MNRKIRRKVAREKRRLDQAVRPNEVGPVLRGNGIRYELAEKAAAIACGGVGVIHRMVKQLASPPRLAALGRASVLQHLACSPSLLLSCRLGHQAAIALLDTVNLSKGNRVPESLR